MLDLRSIRAAGVVQDSRVPDQPKWLVSVLCPEGWLGRSFVVLSVYDQILYQLTCPNCGHVDSIVIGELDGTTEWPCEKCHRPIDLGSGPYRSGIERLRNTASELDGRARQRR